MIGTGNIMIMTVAVPSLLLQNITIGIIMTTKSWVKNENRDTSIIEIYDDTKVKKPSKVKLRKLLKPKK
jgi:hypothetical protein